MFFNENEPCPPQVQFSVGWFFEFLKNHWLFRSFKYFRPKEQLLPVLWGKEKKKKKKKKKNNNSNYFKKKKKKKPSTPLKKKKKKKKKKKFPFFLNF